MHILRKNKKMSKTASECDVPDGGTALRYIFVPGLIYDGYVYGTNMEDEDLLCLKNYIELFERQLC